MAVLKFEEALFPVFEDILRQDIQEFVPYVFQLLSLFLEFRESPVPDHYMELFPCLLSPILWERVGNIPALSRLMQAFIDKEAHKIVNSQKLNGVLGVFQKLIASKTNDHEGFFILMRLVENLPPETLNEYLKHIFVLLFHRLSNSKTTKYVKSLLAFFFSFLISMVLELSLHLLIQFSLSIWKCERKICSVGLIKLLTEAPELIDGCYSQFWGPLLQALIGLFELPEDDSIPEDEHFIEVDETPGYQSAFCKLLFAGKAEHDPMNGQIPDARLHLAQSLQKLSVNCPGKLPTLISTHLAPEAAQHLQKQRSDEGEQVPTHPPTLASIIIRTLTLQLQISPNKSMPQSTRAASPSISDYLHPSFDQTEDPGKESSENAVAILPLPSPES
ncbi:exportin-2 [Trichonephila clavata]|uniref:Exportin-2 n=1 Tax=Trichonephila clavata TaxID=2740835 RepID=A0A8X6HB68_TRICU|nr:exportin-2 [Trichonephila clavata]